MGVLGIVGDAGTDNDGFGRYEVKRLWQFRVEFFKAFDDSAVATLLSEEVKKSLTTAAKTVTRPTSTFSEIEMRHGNETWKLAGRTNWASENLEIVFDDVIPKTTSGAGDEDTQFSASAILYEWQNLQQNIVDGSAGLSKDYKANIVVTQFNPAGEQVERIVYHGAWPSNISGDGWDYDSEDGTGRITATFTVDKVYRVEVGDGNNTPPTTIVGTANE